MIKSIFDFKIDFRVATISLTHSWISWWGVGGKLHKWCSIKWVYPENQVNQRGAKITNVGFTWRPWQLDYNLSKIPPWRSLSHSRNVAKWFSKVYKSAGGAVQQKILWNFLERKNSRLNGFYYFILLQWDRALWSIRRALLHNNITCVEYSGCRTVNSKYQMLSPLEAFKVSEKNEKNLLEIPNYEMNYYPWSCILLSLLD